MTLTISENEYKAINFAVNQIQTEIEGASDKVFLEDANKHQSALYHIMVKYKKARKKANNFHSIRKVIVKKTQGWNLKARDIDSMTRKVLKKMNENT